MNRQERRKEQKLEEWVKSLPTDKLRMIERVAVNMSRIEIEAYSHAYERVLRVKFYEMLDNSIEAEGLLKEVLEGVETEGRKIKELLNEGEIYKMEIKDKTKEIIEKYLEEKSRGIKENAIIKDLVFMFPKMTKTAIKNIIVEYKRDNEEDEKLDAALEEIFPKIEEKVKEKIVAKKEKEVPKKEKEVSKTIEKAIIPDLTYFAERRAEIEKKREEELKELQETINKQVEGMEKEVEALKTKIADLKEIMY